MNCINCKTQIDSERLEVLPHTTTCATCSTTERATGYMVYNHKTAGSLVIIPNDPETQRIAKRANRRAR